MKNKDIKRLKDTVDALAELYADAINDSDEYDNISVVSSVIASMTGQEARHSLAYAISELGRVINSFDNMEPLGDVK